VSYCSDDCKCARCQATEDELAALLNVLPVGVNRIPADVQRRERNRRKTERQKAKKRKADR